MQQCHSLFPADRTMSVQQCTMQSLAVAWSTKHLYLHITSNNNNKKKKKKTLYPSISNPPILQPVANRRTPAMATRLNAIQRHLVPPPFSTENSPTASNNKPPLIPLPTSSSPPQLSSSSSSSSDSLSDSLSDSDSVSTPATMSSQPSHPTLLIPGPIEFDDAVLQSMGHYA